MPSAPSGLVRKGDEALQILLSELIPAPENDRIYRPVNPDDPATIELAESIRRYGIRNPLTITTDRYIISGHRRRVAAKLAGLKAVPCRVEPITHDDPRFLALLVAENEQRVKTAEEVAREAVVKVNAADAYLALKNHREQRARIDAEDLIIDIKGVASRSAISEAKWPMLQAALLVAQERRRFWPLTLRQIHYALLNDPPPRNATRQKTGPYRNDRKSYNDLSDLLIRARLEGLMPWEAIDDPTRPIVTSGAWSGVGPFVRQDMENFLRGYYRDLQQSQPLHIEIVGEKNTVRNIIEPVAAEFCVPFTLGRGYASASPRKKMVERFRQSGRETLVLLVVSDFDPEGEDIPHQFARSLRDDFGVPEVELAKVALTARQVHEMGLPPVLKVKEDSSRAKGFVEEYGDDVWELEAVPPEQMQGLLDEAIRSFLDIDAFNAELAAEEQDAAVLEGMRRRAMAVMQSVDLGGGGMP